MAASGCSPASGCAGGGGFSAGFGCVGVRDEANVLLARCWGASDEGNEVGCAATTDAGNATGADAALPACGPIAGA